MAYLRGRDSYRDAYEEHFEGMDGREVTVHRVINIAERRNPMHRELDRGFDGDQWYGGPRNYQHLREYHNEGSYPPNDRQYYDDNAHFRRNSPPPRNEALYSQQSYSRHDLRHHLASRSRGRAGPHFRNRGRGSGAPSSSGPDRKFKSLRSHPEDGHKNSPTVAVKRSHSPESREAQPPVRSGSNTSNKSFSPETDKNYTHQQTLKKHKSSVVTEQTPSSPVEVSPPSSGSTKEKTPASAVETEEVVTTSIEPKLTPEDDFKARRREAIKAKAQEIEKHFRQDCETFRTVVKMLAAKEPSLESLLQAPLDENLLELKQRCLDDLRNFVKELDEIIDRGGEEEEYDGTQSSTTTQDWMVEDLPQLSSTDPLGIDGIEEKEEPPRNIEGSAHAVPRNQIQNMEDSTLDPEIHRSVRQVILSISEPDPNKTEPKELPSNGPPASAQQGPGEVFDSRLQLFGLQGETFSNATLSNPHIWQNIAYVKPGWVPDRLPFLQPGKQYAELKANSTVVSCRGLLCVKSSKKKKRKDLACTVTCYDHTEGPWCEVQSEEGSRICILAAGPTA